MSFKWYKSDEELIPNEKYSIINETNDSLKSSLIFMEYKTSQNQNGVYICSLVFSKEDYTIENNVTFVVHRKC